MDEKRLFDLLERIAASLERLATQQPARPQAQAAPAADQPTFAGFTCSWTVDAGGYPSYLVTPDGEIADKHERQGDTWYSTRDPDAEGGYRRVFAIKAGETLPPEAQFKLPAPPAQTAQEQPTAPPEDAPTPDPADRTPAQPAGPEALRTLHALGRRLHGDEWASAGPQLITAHSDGRTAASAELSAAECQSLTSELQAQLQRRADPAYAG